MKYGQAGQTVSLRGSGPLQGVMWQVHLRYDHGFMICTGTGNSCSEGIWIRGPGKFVTFKRAGRETPACMAGVDIQHMHLMSHYVLSYNNYDITSKYNTPVAMAVNIASVFFVCDLHM